MREVTLFTVSGKNLHDDSVDALAMEWDKVCDRGETVVLM